MAAPNRIPDRLGAPQVSAARQASSAESGSLLPAALAGLAASALAVWVVSGELRFAALTFTAMRYVAAAYLLLMAGLAWITCYGVGRLLRRKATRQVALHTAVTALWLAPAAIFLRDHSEWSSLAVGALVISVARLTGSFRDPVSEERFDQPRIPFGEIQASIPPGELAPALGAVLLIEGAFAAILAERPLVAALFVALGAWICIRRYQEHSAPDLSRKPRVSVRATLASVLMVLALLPHLVLQVGGDGRGRTAGHGWVVAGGRDWSLIGAIKALLGVRPGAEGIPGGIRASAGTKNGRGNSDPKLEGTPSPGVVLFPDLVPQVTTLVAPPPDFGGEGNLFGKRHDEPLTIPFAGVYWILRSPDRPPPDTSLVERGNPATKGYLSNDYLPLWMEAHQTLNTRIHLDCCSAMRVELTDGDYGSSQVKLELELSDTQQGGAKQSLGIQQVTTDFVQPRPRHRVLTFAVPPTTRLQTFDRITVHFWLGFRHFSRSAKISLDRFVLVPRAR